MCGDNINLPLMGGCIISQNPFADPQILSDDEVRNRMAAMMKTSTAKKPVATKQSQVKTQDKAKPVPKSKPVVVSPERERSEAMRLADTDERFWTEEEKAAQTSRRLALHSERHTCTDAADWLVAADEPDEPIIEELIERGEMFALVGQSKAGKSLLALQMAVCVATGRDFIGRHVVRSRVYLANLEVSRKQYKKRLRHLCQTIGINLEELKGWLFIDNMKGDSTDWQWLLDEAKLRGAALVMIDPFYQVFKGAETHEEDCLAAVEEMKRFQKDGLTLGIVFHSPKGFSGDRQLIDMISGSSVLARFPESIFGILNHATENSARVIDCELRNYAKPDPFTVKFTDGAFVATPGLTPEVKSSGKKLSFKSPEERKKEKAAAYDKEQTELREALGKILNKAGDNLLAVSQVKDRLAAAHFGKHAVEDFLRAREADGEIVRQPELIDEGENRGKPKPRQKGGKTYVSTPERIASYLKKFEELPL